MKNSDTTPLTIQDLIRHFEDRMKRLDRGTAGAAVGREPQYPMLVVYLGEAAMAGHPAMAARLLQAWPQYQRELKFLGVSRSPEKTVGKSEEIYVSLSCEGDPDASFPLEPDDLGRVTSSLFGSQTHFSDRSRLLIYFVLDTTSFSRSEEFDVWMEAVTRVKKYLGVGSLDVLDMLLLLLNEDFVRQGVAGQIRNILAGFYGETPTVPCNSVFVLSNRRDDNAILEDWDICYGLFASVVALSNNPDARVTGRLFHRAVLTASCAREEKPSAEIGQTLVRELIDLLEEEDTPQEARIDDWMGDGSRLGLTPDGTMALLDRYTEEHLFPLLPTEEQLEFFPRRDCEAYGRMADLSEREFNDRTMNAWACYLAQVVQNARERVRRDTGIRKQWETAYTNQITQNFSREEQIYLADHLDDVRRLLETARKPSAEGPVLSSAYARLKYMVSSERALQDIFMDAIRACGERARAFHVAWAALLRSQRQVFAVRDPNVAAYYGKRARAYFDRCESKLRAAFQQIASVDELRAFLESTLDDMVDSDAIYTAPFEEELEKRLQQDTLPIDAKQYVRKKLTGGDVHTYLQVDFSFGEPVLSAIFMKIGTALYQNLFANLSPDTYYYDTGHGDAAEAIVVYEVTRQNLIVSC